MPVDVETTIEIGRPRDVVARYAADPDHATAWYVNIESVEWKTPPPAVQGSQIAFVARFLGRRIAYTYEVRRIVVGELFVMSTADGPFPMQTTYSWEDTPDGGTRMRLRNAGSPKGFASIASGAMTHAMRRANNKDLRLLKHVLESGADSPR